MLSTFDQRHSKDEVLFINLMFNLYIMSCFGYQAPPASTLSTQTRLVSSLVQSVVVVHGCQYIPILNIQYLD